MVFAGVVLRLPGNATNSIIYTRRQRDNMDALYFRRHVLTLLKYYKMAAGLFNYYRRYI